MLISPRHLSRKFWMKKNENNKKKQDFLLCTIWLDLPISSINGAIRNVTPTKSKHINNSRHAVAMIVHLARCDISSGSITWNRIKKKMKWNGMKMPRKRMSVPIKRILEMSTQQHKHYMYTSKRLFESRFMFHIKLGFRLD